MFYIFIACCQGCRCCGWRNCIGDSCWKGRVQCDGKPSHVGKPLTRESLICPAAAYLWIFRSTFLKVFVTVSTAESLVFPFLLDTRSVQFQRCVRTEPIVTNYTFSTASCQRCLSCERGPVSFLSVWEMHSLCFSPLLTSTFMLIMCLFTLRLRGGVFLILYFTFRTVRSETLTWRVGE